jgi:hypothetical protein
MLFNLDYGVFLPRNSWYTQYSSCALYNRVSYVQNNYVGHNFGCAHVYCQITFTLLLMLNKLQFLSVRHERYIQVLLLLETKAHILAEVVLKESLVKE